MKSYLVSCEEQTFVNPYILIHKLAPWSHVTGPCHEGKRHQCESFEAQVLDGKLTVCWPSGEQLVERLTRHDCGAQ